MTYWAVSPILAVLLYGFFGVYVYAQPRKSPVNRAYLLLVGAMFLWALLEFLQQLPLPDYGTRLIVRLLPLTWGALGFLSINFSNVLLGRKPDLPYWASTFFVALLSVTALTTDTIQSSYEISSWGVREIDGPLMVPFIFTNVALPVVYSLVILWRARKSTNPQMKKIFSLVISGGILALIIGISFELVIPMIAGPEWPQPGPLTTIFMAMFVHGAVVRHNFLSVGIEEAAIQIFESTPEGIIISHQQNTSPVTNSEARRIVDRVSKLEGRSHEWVLDKLIDSGREHGLREVAFGEGEEKIFLATISAPMEKTDTIVGLVVTIRDITEERVAALEKSRLEDHLRQAQKMEAVGTLAGGLAHDMNNVLTGIMGCASMLLSDLPAGSSQSADVLSILESSRRGRDLTSDLLGFARKSKYRKKRISLNSAAQDVLPLLRRTVPRSISIEYRSDGHLMDVDADPGQLSHLIMNLCINATDAIKDVGKVIISTSLIETDDQRWAKLKVTDNGRGMDKDTLERVFEPFFTTKDVGKGTGLGLSMVYGTTISHGGTVHIESTPGEGTRVWVMLPLSGLTNEVSRGISVPPLPPVSSKVSTILMVDDEALVRRTAKRILEKMGYNVLEAGDGAEAVSIYEEQWREIDLILLDLSMPVMDGNECFDRLRTISREAKVIISSGYARDPDADDLLEKGAVGYLAKPYEMSNLIEIISVNTNKIH